METIMKCAGSLLKPTQEEVVGVEIDARIKSVRVRVGPLVGQETYYKLDVHHSEKITSVVHPFAPFRDLEKKIRAAGHAELVRAQFPILSTSVSFVRLTDLDLGQSIDNTKRAEQLEVWLAECLQLAQWGVLNHATEVKALSQLLLTHEEDGFVSKEEKEDVVQEAQGEEIKIMHDVQLDTTIVKRTKSSEVKSKRIEELESMVTALRARLAEHSSSSTQQRKTESEESLEELEQSLRLAAERLLAGDETAEHDLDALDTKIRAHPDYLEKQAQMDADWERAQIDHNTAARATMRKIVPRDISTRSLADLELLYEKYSTQNSDGWPRRLAKRIHRSQALWLIWLPAERIMKLHPADLAHRFNVSRLDLIELRAVYASLPITFDSDPNGLKAKWRNGVRTKLIELTKHSSSDRNAAYRGIPTDLDITSENFHENQSSSILKCADISKHSLLQNKPPTSSSAPTVPLVSPSPARSTTTKPSRPASASSTDLLAAIQNRRRRIEKQDEPSS